MNVYLLLFFLTIVATAAIVRPLFERAGYFSENNLLLKWILGIALFHTLTAYIVSGYTDMQTLSQVASYLSFMSTFTVVTSYISVLLGGPNKEETT